MSISLSKLTAAQLNKFFVERVHKIHVYPANWVFRMVWAIISVFFDKRTVEKLTLYPGRVEA